VDSSFTIIGLAKANWTKAFNSNIILGYCSQARKIEASILTVHFLMLGLFCIYCSNVLACCAVINFAVNNFIIYLLQMAKCQHFKQCRIALNCSAFTYCKYLFGCSVVLRRLNHANYSTTGYCSQARKIDANILTVQFLMLG